MGPRSRSFVAVRGAAGLGLSLDFRSLGVVRFSFEITVRLGMPSRARVSAPTRSVDAGLGIWACKSLGVRSAPGKTMRGRR